MRVDFEATVARACYRHGHVNSHYVFFLNHRFYIDLASISFGLLLVEQCKELDIH